MSIKPDWNWFPREVIALVCKKAKERSEARFQNDPEWGFWNLTPLGDVEVICRLYGVIVCAGGDTDPERLFRAWQHAVLGRFDESLNEGDRTVPIVGPRVRDQYAAAPEDSGNLRSREERTAFMEERYIKVRKDLAENPCEPYFNHLEGEFYKTSNITPRDKVVGKYSLADTLTVFWMKLVQRKINKGDSIESVAEEALYESGLYHLLHDRKADTFPVRNCLWDAEDNGDWGYAGELHRWLVERIFGRPDPTPEHIR